MLFYNLTCAWCFIANSSLLNIEWPDGNSQYYGTIVNSSFLKIDGYFPNSRYFSFEVYDLKTLDPFWDIHDVNIGGKLNPYRDQAVTYNTSLVYQIDLNADKKDERVYQENEYYLLIYRIYMGINNTGGVPLPHLSLFYDKKWNVVEQCNDNNRPTIDIQDTTPQYYLYKPNENNNFYPPQNKSNLFINYDAKYMVAFYDNSNNTFRSAKIKLKVPTYPTNMNHIAENDYKVRYFSMSIVDLSIPRQTTQTIGDVVLYNNSLENQEVCLYLFCHYLENISLQLYPPSKNNNHNCSSQTKYFGVLYRQLLPQFVHEIPDTPSANQNEIIKLMGSYYPEITWI
tara:strand:- start:1196 stop:2218 length:1023 start_codon:yes stop_codon:yes gene_type:complete